MDGHAQYQLDRWTGVYAWFNRLLGQRLYRVMLDGERVGDLTISNHVAPYVVELWKPKGGATPVAKETVRSLERAERTGRLMVREYFGR